MVLTKSELIASLQNEVRILLHLASKIEPTTLDYRPTPKQRSTIELLKYLCVMGPGLVEGRQGRDVRPCRLDGRRRRPPRREISSRRSPPSPGTATHMRGCWPT